MTRDAELEYKIITQVIDDIDEIIDINFKDYTEKNEKNVLFGTKELFVIRLLLPSSLRSSIKHRLITKIEASFELRCYNRNGYFIFSISIILWYTIIETSQIFAPVRLKIMFIYINFRTYFKLSIYEL